MVGLGGLEPPTSRLSGVRSNQLSYKPIFLLHSFLLLALAMYTPGFPGAVCLLFCFSFCAFFAASELHLLLQLWLQFLRF